MTNQQRELSLDFKILDSFSCLLNIGLILFSNVSIDHYIPVPYLSETFIFRNFTSLDARSNIAKAVRHVLFSCCPLQHFDFQHKKKKEISPRVPLNRELGTQPRGLVDILVFTHLAAQSQVELILLLLCCVVE